MTTCYIGELFKSGNLRVIFCKYDGYPAHTGKMLLEHYNSHDLASSLIALGNLSMVGERLSSDKDEPHTLETHASNDEKSAVTIAYNRDGNMPYDIVCEKMFPSLMDEKYAKKAKQFIEKMARNECIDYVYLYDHSKGGWYVADINGRPIYHYDSSKKEWIPTGMCQRKGFKKLSKKYIKEHP